VNGFAGKRILFIGIGFYDYEISIVARLRRYGATVQSFFDRPAILRRGLFEPLSRLAAAKALRLITRHQNRILRSATGPCDFVLVIKAIDLRPEFLDALRCQLPHAEFILYQWDALARLPGIESRLPYFDRILTFDHKDFTARPGLQFRPLFYRENPSRPNMVHHGCCTIDLCFVGLLHSDRLEMIRRLQANAQSQGVSFYVYLYTGLYTSLKLARARNARNIHFRLLSYRKLMELSRRTAVILDLPHAAQSGMTMRAIEAVGLGKKLITTASDVIHYDFFSIENVQLLQTDDLRLDREFICKPPAPYPETIRRRYSLDAWLEDVFRLSTAESVA
jgi:hypothetical protein